MYLLTNLIMKKTIATILSSTFVFMILASYYSQLLDLPRRDRRGTLYNDVVRVHTYHGNIDVIKVEKNYKQLKKLIRCGLDPVSCKSLPPDSEYLNRTRSEA